ncbi:MAG: hypothetical protein AMXMBFR46_25460 [Acidimicrobiia bacterium]
MTIDEQGLRIRRSLEEKVGVEEASYLMDRPIGGWSELVTNQTLALHFAVLDERFAVLDERFAVLDERFAVLDERFRSIDARFSAVDAQITALRHELKGDMERGFRRQTWALMSVVVTGFTAVLAALVAQSGS